MKRISISLTLMALFFSALNSCTKAEKIMEEAKVVFYALTPKDTLTKSYIDSDLNVLWTADDRLSVFRGPANEQYRYTGQTGQDEGAFEKVSGDDPSSFYSHNYGIYPYTAGNSSTAEGAINITLPATQSYAANSFGLGSNTMSAVTVTANDNIFKFKNVCGYLLLKVYGGDRIRSIVFRGNNGEKIAGSATLTTSYGEIPTVAMSDLSTTEITLDCGDDGVATGATKDECTNFWMVVPPTAFTGGFTVEITNTDGQTVTKSTSKSMSITRNVIQPMAAIKVDTQADNDLLTFSLSDGTNTYDAFDISNGYVNVQVPNGTDMTSMTATFTHNGASVKVGDTPQTSGTGTHDFSDFVYPLTYVVSSKSGVESSYIIRMFDLPIVIATTPGGTAITSKEVWTEGCSFAIREASGTITDYGTTSLRGRGNYTWSFPKKAYTVKFSSKASVLGMNSDKRWNLLANWRDRTLIRNAVGLEIARHSGLDWTSDGRFVELILNGEYLGNYYLCEHIKVGENRVNITEISQTDTTGASLTGGYLMEYDTYYDELNKFRSATYNYPVNIKSPDEEGYDVQISYIRSYINSLESYLSDSEELSKRTYLQYIDIDSFIEWWLVYEIVGNGYEPSGPRSCFFNKDRSEKIKAGPVWDFDGYTFRQGITGFQVKQALYYKQLFKCPYFVARVKEKWPYVKQNLEGMANFIDDQINYIHNSSLRDAEMWPITGAILCNYDESLPVDEANARLKEVYIDRISELNQLINSLTVDYDDKSGGNEDYDGQNDDTGDFDFGTN